MTLQCILDFVYCVFVACRRHYLRAWFTEVIEKFKDCSSLPDWGKSLEWPNPPIPLKVPAGPDNFSTH